MKQARFAWLWVFLVAAGCRHASPPGLAPMSLSALQHAFNAEQAHTRVVALLSPT
jgi:hypothetical protein